MQVHKAKKALGPGESIVTENPTRLEDKGEGNTELSSASCLSVAAQTQTSPESRGS